MILAGDIGGTKTIVAAFRNGEREPVALETYRSREHAGLEEMVRGFLDEHRLRVTRACFGVAGPVSDGRSATVNLAWPVDARSLARALGLDRVGLINDLDANARGIATLTDDDFAVLNAGERTPGTAAVISAGTGLGMAGLIWDGQRHRVAASEGGHADFAPRTDREDGLYRWLSDRYDHVSYERVLSGMGLVNTYRYLAERGGHTPPPAVADALDGVDAAAAISRAGLDGSSAVCAEALDVFASVYGSAAGNLALTLLSVGGVYLGGGIAPKLLAKLTDGTFLRAFLAKGRMSSLLGSIPVRVVLNERTALYGAARLATEG